MLIVFFLVLFLSLLALPVWYWRGAPFLPTDPAKIGRILRLVQVRPGERVADLGSGDGRFVLAAARVGAEVVGFEINPLLVWWSRYLVWRAGLSKVASIRTANFWRQDLAALDVVFVFGVGGRMMYELEAKLRRELKSGARVVSNGFPFPSWPVAARDGSLYLYRQGN